MRCLTPAVLRQRVAVALALVIVALVVASRDVALALIGLDMCGLVDITGDLTSRVHMH